MKNLVGLLLIALVVLLVRDASAQTQPCEITGVPNGTKVWSVLGQLTIGGNTVGALSGPLGAAVDPVTGTVVVTNSGLSALSYFNGTAYLTSNVSSPVRSLGFPTKCNESGLNAPNGIVFTKSGACFVSDSGNFRVLRFDSCGSLATNATFKAAQVIGQAANNTCSAGSFLFPGNVTLSDPRQLGYDSASDTLFVPDFTLNAVYVFKGITTKGAVVRATNQLFGTGASGTTTSQVSGPSGAAYDPTSGALFVADFNNNRVLKWNSAFTLANSSAASFVFGTLSSTMTNASTFTNPYGLFLSSSGTLFVSDNSLNRVLGFNNAGAINANGPNATFVLGNNFKTGTASTGGEGFKNPAGVFQSATTPVGSVTLVADSGNNRVVVYLCKASPSISTSNSASISFSNSNSNSISTSNSNSNSISTSNSGSNSISTSNSGSPSSPASKAASQSKPAVTKSVAAGSSKVAGSSVGSASVSLVIFKCHRPCRNACNVCAAIGGTCKNVGNGKYQCVSPRSAFAFRYQVPGRQTCPPTNGKPHLTALCKAAGGTFSCTTPRGNRRSSFTFVTCSKSG